MQLCNNDKQLDAFESPFIAYWSHGKPFIVFLHANCALAIRFYEAKLELVYSVRLLLLYMSKQFSPVRKKRPYLSPKNLMRFSESEEHKKKTVIETEL